MLFHLFLHITLPFYSSRSTQIYMKGYNLLVRKHQKRDINVVGNVTSHIFQIPRFCPQPFRPQRSLPLLRGPQITIRWRGRHVSIIIPRLYLRRPLLTVPLVLYCINCSLYVLHISCALLFCAFLCGFFCSRKKTYTPVCTTVVT